MWFVEAPGPDQEIVPEFVDKSAEESPAEEPAAPPPEEEPAADEEMPEEEPAEESEEEAEEEPEEKSEEEPGEEPEEEPQPAADAEADVAADESQDEPEEEPEEEPQEAEAPSDEDDAELAAPEDEEPVGESEAEPDPESEEEPADPEDEDDEPQSAEDATSEETQEDEEGKGEDFFAKRSERIKSKALRSNVPAVKKDSSATIVGGWIVLIAFVLTTAWIISFKQQFLIEAWPPSQKLYDTLGVEIEIKKEVAAPLPDPQDFVEFTHGAENEIIDGHIKLSISGQLTNNGIIAVEIPELRGILRNAAKEEIRSWAFAVEPATLMPGEERRFSTTVEDIPPETAEYELFIDWPDQSPVNPDSSN